MPSQMSRLIVSAATAAVLFSAAGAHAKGAGHGFSFAGKSMSASGRMTIGTRPHGFPEPHVKAPMVKAHTVKGG